MPCPSDSDAPDKPASYLEGSTKDTPLLAAAAESESHVVSKTTPLITLGEISLLYALHELYGEVWIPDTVFAEYERGRTAHPQRPYLREFAWMSVHPVTKNSQIPTSLDAGERDAIALALSIRAPRILLDERHARAVAIRLRLTVTGSIGIVLAAKRRGIIDLVKPLLDEIIAQGRFIGPDLYDQILRQAHE